MPWPTDAIANLPLRDVVPDRSDMPNYFVARNDGASVSIPVSKLLTRFIIKSHLELTIFP
jgi:hypothetical protein